MPYIDAKQRLRLSSGEDMKGPGDLNYLVTELVLKFLGEHPRYTDFNAAIGALECCKLELYRRMVAPYEDEKIAQNGDVYPAAEAAPEFVDGAGLD